ncbi:response regulator transcription factor [Kroppenstedtia pulmonis]|uniref:Response regulator transcription factor n=1 Tax=Kroppenstedtia pulmonis TaxID=1380685 RepID=A0A7D3XHV0_9BACL|nr:response regulator transcription factor [Kroppenstedtia pulmonis]QKG83459.1 response regulator transcription factor [Kroppenstedtia pulmonis]
MDSKGILIIEDEVRIARVIQLELEYEGYRVEIATNGTEGLDRARQKKWDLILLDIMIPGLNGIEVLRRYRAEDRATPVILLTARDTIPDKVMGLDQGANDYMTKPFEIEELLARIRACIRTHQIQKQSGEEETLVLADLKVQPQTRMVVRAGQAMDLTPREFNLLVYLLQNKNQVLNREQIITHVWGYDFEGDTNVVDVYIRYLRKKIDAGFDVPLIQTVRGVGYRMREPKYENSN